MKWTICLPILVALSQASLLADVVELVDGTRIEGTILAENADSIEIEIGTNAAGTIRRVLIIDAREIRTWMANKEGPRASREPQQVQRSGSKEYIERLILEAQREIDVLNYDAGIAEFGQAAELAVKDVESLPLRDQSEMFNLHAHAFRMQLAALEGKENMLEERTKTLEDKVEEVQKQFEEEMKQFEDDKKDYEDKVGKIKHGELGTRRKINEIQEREQQLKIKEGRVVAFQNQSLLQIDQMEKDLLQTQMQIELTKERVDRAEDEAKRAEKASRKR